jgi:hypothetical protein
MLMRFALIVATGIGPTVAAAAAPTETVDQALCRSIDDAATAHGLPVTFLTRLIWRESSFRTGVVSPAGAQGIAQFMPGTAAERGLRDAFDPEQALPASARLLAELRDRFGNLGLAAAAYNAGPSRVDNWLAGRGGLPNETRRYVAAITGRSAEDWSRGVAGPPAAPSASEPEPATCLAVVAAVRNGAAEVVADLPALREGPFAPWGVQVAGQFSKPMALALYRQVAARHETLFADAVPMVIGTRLRFRGGGTFWRVRVPAASRADAETWCGRLRRAGGHCAVLKS